MDYEKIYKKCCLIRTFEKTVEKNFEHGKMRGTTHGCVGQEIIPVLAMEYINGETDYITGTHRCHGQVLAYTKDPYRLACEMMGKEDGFNCGMGGSQHIKVEHYLTNGVTGGMAAIGSGMALSLKKRSKDGIVLSFLGDGGFQEGYVAESMGIASVMEAPILYIIENNHYAMSTPTARYAAGNFEDRIGALNIKSYNVKATEIDNLNKTFSAAIEYVRTEKKPAGIVVDTFRLCGHSKSDDMAYMSEEERKSNLENDPLRVLENKIGDADTVERIKNEVSILIQNAFEQAEQCAQIGYKEYKTRIGL